MKVVVGLLALVALSGCAPEKTVRLDAPPKLSAAQLETTDDGRPILRIRNGALVGASGKLLTLPPGESTVLVVHDGEADDGEEPVRAALWLRGRGDRRHLLPNLVSPLIELGTSDDWTIAAKPGLYDLSVSMGGDGSVTTVMVR